MLDSQILIEAMYNYGREKAFELRVAAPELTDTEVIEQELFIPHWKEGLQIKDAPLQYDGQVYRVLQAHDSTGNPSWTPAAQSALFSICHTKNPYKAKPWVTPQGISGMYELGDCYIDDEGIVWRQIYNDSNVYDAATLPERWEMLNIYGIEIGDTDATGESGVPIESEPETPNEWPEWVQPVGAQDAYAQGAQVSHNNKHWVSSVDSNVWEPGVYGWIEDIR